MGEPQDDRQVTAIVAAYNEAKRIGSVLDVLCSYPGFAEVIVVDDGSTDATASVASEHGARVIMLQPNRGKGYAMDAGVRAATTEVLFFADADIAGLTSANLDQIVQPVVRGDAEMFVAMRRRAVYYLKFIMVFIPLLGGERALTRHLWTSVPDRYKAHFQIEAALNFYAIHYGSGLRFRVFKEISQTVKERKFGLREGLVRRLRMSRDVVRAMWTLQFENAPASLRLRRSALFGVLAALAGAVLGLMILLAAVVGPAHFIGAIFAEELAEDPGARFVGFLLTTASALGTGALTLMGALLMAGNGLLAVFNLFRLAGESQKRTPD